MRSEDAAVVNAVTDAAALVEATAWSRQLRGSWSDADITSAAWSPDVALLHSANHITAIAPDGSIIWEQDGEFVHPEGKVSPLFAVERAATGVVLHELHPRQGVGLRSLPLPAITSDVARFFVDGSDILTVSGTTVRKLSVADGGELWSASLDAEPRRPPVFAADQVVFQDPYASLDRASGKQLWRFKGVCCTALVLDDGFVVREKESSWVRLDRKGTVRASTPGRAMAAAATDVLYEDNGGLRIQGSDGASKVVVARAKGQAFGALAMTERWVSYFTYPARELRLVDRSNGNNVLLHKPSPRQAITPDGPDTSPAAVVFAPLLTADGALIFDGAWRFLPFPPS